MKALLLLLVVIFAVPTTAYVLGLSSGQIAGKSVDITKSYSHVQTANGTVNNPNGEDIDTPIMPG
jgi:uncharacterized protein (UPF0333 family)